MSDRTCPQCGGEVVRVPRLYSDGRPLLKCSGCGARFVDEAVEPSFKGLANTRRPDRTTE